MMFVDYLAAIRRRIGFAFWECAYRIDPMGFVKQKAGTQGEWVLADALINLARRPERRAAIEALIASLEAKGRFAIDRRGSDDMRVWRVREL